MAENVDAILRLDESISRTVFRCGGDVLGRLRDAALALRSPNLVRRVGG
jgi:hypothetical protein